MDHIKNVIEKAAYEVLGKKNEHIRKRGLKIWSEEIDKAIKEKQTAYKIYLQNPTEITKEIYRTKRNLAKNVTMKAHQESWERFISNIENDIHGRQTIAYKIRKHMNSTEKRYCSNKYYKLEKMV
jgi:hypothetical protein